VFSTQALRQPGSNFKPFIYSAALDNGFTPASFVNDAPIVAAPIANFSIAEKAPFVFTVPNSTFYDADADTLTYTATQGNGSALPAWLSFDAATRTFSGTPGNSNVGAVTLKVTATDPSNTSATNQFTLTVNNVNDAPTVTFTTATDLNGTATVTVIAQDDGGTSNGGVNRVVIRCFEDQIRVNVNGEDVFDLKDSTFRKGRIGIGAIAFGPPPTVSFDNIIITTPTEG